MSDSLSAMKAILAKVGTGTALDDREAEKAFGIIMSGDATPAQIGGFLMALRVRGETIGEITGAVRAMRAKVLFIEAPGDAMDIVGTGGDDSGTYNISTTAALVAAGCGVTIAKHGNRNLSSISGAADVLSQLGVNLDADMSLVKKAIWQGGIGFLMAPRHHSAMRHVGGPRAELGTRTIFNLMGPLSNPSLVKRQFSGAFARQWIEPMARVLGNLGSEKAWVVHGADGLDELTTTGPSYVAELKDGKVTCFEVSPDEADIPLAGPEDLKGGNPETNAAALRQVLAGAKGPYRDIVVYNTAAALVVADRATSLRQGAEMAAAAIDDGRAKMKLDTLVAITNEDPPADGER